MGTETNPWFWKSSDLELSCFSDEALITCIFMYLCSCKHYIPITKNESVVALMDLAGSPELSNKIWDRVEPCLDLWPTKWNCPLDPFGRKKIEKEFWRIKAKLLPFLVTYCPAGFWMMDFVLECYITHSPQFICPEINCPTKPASSSRNLNIVSKYIRFLTGQCAAIFQSQYKFWMALAFFMKIIFCSIQNIPF